MTRIYVTEPNTADPYDYEPPQRAGYFDPDKAQLWTYKSEWDGNNNIDINTRSYGRFQYLYRTAQGRWVLNHATSWQGETETYEYISADVAREWLLFNDHDDAVKEHFGDPEQERGPGRPEVGNAVSLRLGDVLPKLDTYAAEHGMSRADAARHLLTTALA